MNSENRLKQAIARARISKDVVALFEIKEILHGPDAGEDLTRLLGTAFIEVKNYETAFEVLLPLAKKGDVLAALPAADAASRLSLLDSTVALIRTHLQDPVLKTNNLARCMFYATRVRAYDLADQIFDTYGGEVGLNSYLLKTKAELEQFKGNHVSARYFARKAIDLDPENIDLKIDLYERFMHFEDLLEFNYEGRNFLFYTHEVFDIDKKKTASSFEQVKMLEFIRDELGPQKTFLDIGCHIGKISRYVQEFVEHDLIVGFDSAPNAAQFYYRNVRNAILYNVALGIEGEEVLLLGDILNNRWGQSRIAKEGEQGRIDAKPMRTRALDSFAFQNVTLMKIDVESWELKVLEGARNTLKKCRPDIIMEVILEDSGTYYRWLRENLRDYEIVKTFRETDDRKHDICLRHRSRGYIQSRV